MLLLCAGLYAALAGFLFGYDLGCINGALPVLLNDTSLALSDEQAEQIVAHCKVGAAVGALISILLMQHGHLRSFWASSLCFVAGPLLLAGSRSWPVLALVSQHRAGASLATPRSSCGVSDLTWMVL